MPDQYIKSEHGAWFKITADGHAISCEEPTPHLQGAHAQGLESHGSTSPQVDERNPEEIELGKKGPRTFTAMGYAKRRDSTDGKCLMF